MKLSTLPSKAHLSNPNLKGTPLTAGYVPDGVEVWAQDLRRPGQPVFPSAPLNPQRVMKVGLDARDVFLIGTSATIGATPGLNLLMPTGEAIVSVLFHDKPEDFRCKASAIGTIGYEAIALGATAMGVAGAMGAVSPWLAAGALGLTAGLCGWATKLSIESI